MTPVRPFLRPRALQRGDRVALLTLASPSTCEAIEAGADELRTIGFEPVVMPAAPAASDGARVPYVAGAAAARAAQLHAALTDPAIRAVVATRGGYGSADLLPHLDLAVVRASRTLLVGYSDITALLDVVTGHAGLITVHGPMAEGRLARGLAGYDRDGFLRVVTEPAATGAVDAPRAAALQRGEASGILRGGTLTQISALLGTPWAFAAVEPTVLFLDDVNERPYRLDRMLWQLRHSGVLAKVTAIVFNELPGCDEPGGSVTAVDALRHALADFAGPIVTGVPSGHTTGPMVTLPFGVPATVLAHEHVLLSIDGAAVE